MDLRATLSDLYRPDARLYWADLLGSALIGWGGFAVALGAPPFSPIHVMALLVASLALYRAAMFIHEITHRRRAELPGFAVVWNLAVGIPLLLPSFLYEEVHQDHHRLSHYGSDRDPEYVPFASEAPWRIVVFLLAATMLPAALIVRFTALSLASLVHPGLRRFVVTRASALTINPRYVRAEPSRRPAWIAQELGASLLVFGAGVLLATGLLSWSVVAHWYFVATAAALANAIRTLAAHRYAVHADPVGMAEQITDSCNLAGATFVGAAVAELIAPVGLRYHALHHWVAAVPYHNLGTAHRRLVTALPEASAYHRVETTSVRRHLSRLWRAARNRT